MTALLEEEDLLSPAEIAPVAVEAPAEPIGKSCPECGATKSGTGVPFLTDFQIRGHLRQKHQIGVVVKPAKKPVKKPAKQTAPRAQAAKVARPTRKPLGESLARVFLQLGRIVNTTVDPPTGAAIMFEAGALGEAVDGLVAGTFIDRPLQKASAVGAKFEPLVPLVTMPVMIYLLSANPAMAKTLEGELREAVEDILVQSMPLLRKRAARTKATVDAAAELKLIAPELAGSGDPIGALIESFFTQAPAAETEPDEPDSD